MFKSQFELFTISQLRTFSELSEGLIRIVLLHFSLNFAHIFSKSTFHPVKVPFDFIDLLLRQQLLGKHRNSIIILLRFTGLTRNCDIICLSNISWPFGLFSRQRMHTHWSFLPATNFSSWRMHNLFLFFSHVDKTVVKIDFFDHLSIYYLFQ